jgi:putative SOS response-associated peptidase YedK
MVGLFGNGCQNPIRLKLSRNVLLPPAVNLDAGRGASYIMPMCGRTRLSTDYSETRIKLKFDGDYPAPNIPASWNVCPSDPMLVAVRSKDGKRIPQQMRWGLVPWWAKDMKVGFSSINARAETVDTAPAFRDAWKNGQRCLVVTDGFYEWKKPEKQPYAVAMADKSHMVMAGLWEEWTDKKTGERIKSCTIVTCPANAVVGALHDRMPVVLAEEDWAEVAGRGAGDERRAEGAARSVQGRRPDHVVGQQAEDRQRPEQGPRGSRSRNRRDAVRELGRRPRKCFAQAILRVDYSLFLKIYKCPPAYSSTASAARI